MSYAEFYTGGDGKATAKGKKAREKAAAAEQAKEDHDSDEELDLDRDEPLIEKWRHLRKDKTAAKGSNASGEQAWWMVVSEKAALLDKPSSEGKIIISLERGDPVYCVRPTDTWLCIRPQKRPPQIDIMSPTGSWHSQLSAEVPREGWIMWNRQEKGSRGTLLMPVNHLDKLLQYRSTGVSLPREAVMWTLSEVDVFLGSVGFVRPGRESAMMRCSKRLVRSVRGGAFGLEFRVDEQGKSGGVFATGAVSKGTWVEICPLLEVDLKLRMQSEMLRRITLQMVGDKKRYGIVLGFAKVYAVSKTPNLYWSYRGEDEVVLWAAEEVHEGCELSVDFTTPPRPLEEARKGPSTWQAPLVRGNGKLQNAGYVVHGNSGIHGRGVFTTKDTAAGELIECCPALVLDEAGKEAMFSYRWGLKDEEGPGDYFLPLGLGSLYNHSERPTAKGTLDVRRKVLEFYATADMYKGQEVLVSYGDTYFDEDFEGHRKSELLHIESPETDGNLELQKLIECQRALIRAFTSEEFVKEIRERAGQRQKLAAGGAKMVPKEMLGKTKSVHSLFMDTEGPILERFGYPNGSKGAFMMQEDLERACQGLDPSHEAVRNLAMLGTLTHLYDPPPPEYWETVPLDLVVLGTEEEEQPEILTVDVPKKAPLGFVRYMLSLRYPQTGTYVDGCVRLIGGGGQLPYVTLKGSDPLPSPKSQQAGRRLLVSGVGDVWPVSQRLRRFDGEEEEEELTEWQIIWRWLMDKLAQQLCNNFKGGTYRIAGTWDDFKVNDMQFDGHCFIHWIAMTEQRWESFQILQDGRWEATLYPDVRDGSPWVAHKLKGPDNKGHGKNWTVGKHAEDSGQPGTMYKIELHPDDRGLPGRVTWTRFADKEEAAKAQLASKNEVEWVAAQATSEEILESKQRAQDATQLLTEGKQHRSAKRLVHAEPVAPAEVTSPARPPEDSSLPFDFDRLDEVEQAR